MTFYVEETFFSVLNEKTTWGVNNLLKELDKHLESIAPFTDKNTVLALNEGIGQFRQYAADNNITSIGRNQFYNYIRPTVNQIMTEQKLNAAPKAPLTKREAELQQENIKLMEALIDVNNELVEIRGFLDRLIKSTSN